MSMNSVLTCVWCGETGTAYEYQVFSIDSVFRDIGGNYIFCERDAMGEWDPICIGQSENLFDCLGDQSLKDWMAENGATHIHARMNRKPDKRALEMEDLIRRFSPPLNRGLPV